MDDRLHRFEQALPFDEFRLWSQRIRAPMAQAGIEPACLEVLEYVCTEMLNNVLDHSGASRAAVGFGWDLRSVEVGIEDDGRGVYRTLREAYALENEAEAALLLLKGKVTTDPARHTGEGLFFSARACESFVVQSGRTGLSLGGEPGNWAFDAPPGDVVGTRLRFRVGRQDPPRLAEVFDRYCPRPDLAFTHTELPVRLMQQADGSLVSRSQGKRLVMGLERFTSVRFDFTGVDEIRQGFADEVFRVWRAAHPGIRVTVAGAGPAVRAVLRHVGFPATD